jgi:hypothetical protein
VVITEVGVQSGNIRSSSGANGSRVVHLRSSEAVLEVWISNLVWVKVEHLDGANGQEVQEVLNQVEVQSSSGGCLGHPGSAEHLGQNWCK